MDKPSFALLPKGLADGKVFSHFPISGDGDLNFVRSTQATRRGKDFLHWVDSGVPRINEYYFERIKYKNEYPFTSNIDRYTEEGDAVFLEPSKEESIFSKLSSKVLKIQYSGGSFNNRVAINNISPQSEVMNVSLYVKPVSATAFSFRIRRSSGAVDKRISFNFETEGITDDGTGVTNVSFVKAEEGFYKIQGTFSGFTTADDIQYRISGNSQGGADQVILVTGISINGDFQERNSISEYYELKQKGNSLILESGGFNGIEDGNKVGSGSWVNQSSRFNVTQNNELSPYGIKEASKISRTTNSSSSLRYELTKPTESQGRVLSIFAKPKINAKYFYMSAEGDSGEYFFVIYDTENGQPVFSETGGSFKGSEVGSQDYGSGWRRYYLVASTDSYNVITMRVSFSQEITDSYSFFASTGFDGGEMYLFGAQNEVSRNLTSYMRTEGGGFTRNSERCNGAVLNMNGSELSYYVVFKDNGQNTSTLRASVSDDSQDNRISFLCLADERIGFQKVVGGVQESYIALETDNFKKQSYTATNKQDSYKIYINGELESETNSGIEEFDISNLEAFSFDNGEGGSFLRGDVFAVLVFEKVLTQNEIEELDKIFL